MAIRDVLTRNRTGFLEEDDEEHGIGSVLRRMKKPDFKTTEGLYEYAKAVGLEKKAQKVLAEKGEEQKRIFSGGFITDIFDVLNVLQYGVTGMLKGKGFAEGVKTRQSFSDKDALGDNGLPGVIAGIAMDIAVDPLTYIAPLTILKKIPGVAKAGRAIKATAEASRVGKWYGEKFIHKFGKDPAYREMIEKSELGIAVGVQNLADIARKLVDLPQETAKKLLTKDATGRFKRVGLEELKNVLDDNEFMVVSEAWKKIDDLGKEAVDLKMLSKEKFEENFGEYIRNAYEEYEKKKKGIFGFLKKKVAPLKSRKLGLTPEKMTELGQIDNPAYLFFRGSLDLLKDTENVKLFKGIARTFGSKVPREGFAPLFLHGGGLRLFRGKFEPAEDIIKQIGRQTFSQGAAVPQLMEQSFTKVGKAIQYAEELGLKVSKATSGKYLGQATLGGVEKGGTLKLRAFISDTVAHELGHTFDTNLSKVINTKKKFREELTRVTKFMGLGGTQKYQVRATERFAEFVSLYIHKPDKAWDLAPEFTAHFEGEMLQNNRVVELVDKLSDFFQKVDRLPNIKTPLGELDNASYLETAIRKAFPSKTYIGAAKEVPIAYIPENMVKDLTEMIAPTEPTLGNKIVGVFKYGKVILNPATHVRNIISNQILNWWKLGMNPLDPRTIMSNVTAVAEIAKKGGKWIDEAKNVGYGLDTFAANEIFDLFASPGAGRFKKLAKKFADMYQGEENMAKLSAYIFNRSYKSMSIEDAWKAAESATFNYAKVTPFVRKMRTSLYGYPFITFALKATPVAVETAMKAPGRISVFGKIKQAIENQSDIKETAAERAAEPAWVRDGFYIKLPMKDKHGRSAYFDLTYIIPFGDIVAGQFFSRQISRETGLRESVPSALMEKSPLFNSIKEISRNQDFYGDKIWNESDDTEIQLGDLFRYLTKLMSPPLIADQIPGGYTSTGERRTKGVIGAMTPEDKIKQQRTMVQELMRNAGIKIQPINLDIQETYADWDKRKALITLLTEEQKAEIFSTPYVPK